MICRLGPNILDSRCWVKASCLLPSDCHSWSGSWNGHFDLTWWRHQMETFSALLAICAGNSPVPVNSLHKGEWRGTVMFSLICAWINGWVKKTWGWWRNHAHYAVDVMKANVYGMLANNVVVFEYRWLSARLQYLQCVSNGVTAVLH